MAAISALLQLNLQKPKLKCSQRQGQRRKRTKKCKQRTLSLLLFGGMKEEEEKKKREVMLQSRFGSSEGSSLRIPDGTQSRTGDQTSKGPGGKRGNVIIPLVEHKSIGPSYTSSFPGISKWNPSSKDTSKSNDDEVIEY
ncbi:hypothetical protein BDZ91DRAFT_768138 [Kalaharituber pfeilii]|nr:hypothetical protein BDZ91DRAFT_768138 [Kalaharituber pfeilii]